MLIIDRIEGEFAVVEWGNTTFNMPLGALPDGVAEGDCLSVTVDSDATEERKKRIDSLMKKFKR